MGPATSLSRRAFLVAGSVGVGALVGKPDGLTRQELLTKMDTVGGRWNIYTAYELGRQEYVGTITDGDTPPLSQLGYEHNPLAAIKYHPVTEGTDDGSWRRVDSENPRWQWHVHVWKRDDGTREVFSHYEYRPDPLLLDGETAAEFRQRLRDHYNPKWDTEHPPEEANYFLGKASQRIESTVDERGGLAGPDVVSFTR